MSGRSSIRSRRRISDAPAPSSRRPDTGLPAPRATGRSCRSRWPQALARIRRARPVPPRPQVFPGPSGSPAELIPASCSPNPADRPERKRCTPMARESLDRRERRGIRGAAGDSCLWTGALARGTPRKDRGNESSKPARKGPFRRPEAYSRPFPLSSARVVRCLQNPGSRSRLLG